MKDFYKHKKSDKIKWILTLVTFLLVFVMLIGICLQLFGTTEQKPSEWFKSIEQQEQTESNVDLSAFQISNEMFVAPCSSLENVSAVSEDDKTYTSLGVPIKGSDLSILDFIVSSYKVPIKNNLTNSVKEDALLVSLLAGGQLPLRGYVLILPKAQVFTQYDNFEFVDIVVKDNGKEVNPLHPNMFPSDIACYQTLTPSSLEVTYILSGDATVPLPPDPVKEGHSFIGWYYDSAFTRPYDYAPIYEDTQLFAKFEINQYNVTFNSNGGSAISAQIVNWNTAASLTTPTRDKYAFVGWFFENGTQYTNQPITEDTTLVAHWERNVFTVNFDTDGGSDIGSQEVTVNNSVTLISPTKTGHSFKGWFFENGTQYTNQPITEDTTLVAHWEKILCSVTFYVGDEVYSTLSVEYGTSIVDLIEVANEHNLSIISLRSAVGDIENLEAFVVTDNNIEVVAKELPDKEKVVNIVKNNKWAIIGGVVGFIVLMAIIISIVSGIKRKRR